MHVSDATAEHLGVCKASYLISSCHTFAGHDRTCLECSLLCTGSCVAMRMLAEAGPPTGTHGVSLGDNMVQEDVVQGMRGCDVEGGLVLDKGGVGGGKHRQGRMAATGNGSGNVGQQSCRQADIGPSIPLFGTHI